MASDSSDQKKKVVVVKKDDKDAKETKSSDANDVVKIGEKPVNYTPLAGPAAAEEKDTKIAVPKGNDDNIKVVASDNKNDMEPLAAGDVLDADSKSVKSTADNKSNSSVKKSSTGLFGSKTDESGAEKDKEKAGDSSIKSMFSSSANKDKSDRSLHSLSAGPAKSDSIHELSKSANGSKASADGKSISSNKDSNSTGDKSGAAGAAGLAGLAGAAGLAYSGSSNAKKCAKCSKDTKECRCLNSSTGSTAGSTGTRDSRTTIDEGRNKNHRIVGGFIPEQMATPVPESILCELRRKNSIISEGFGFKKRTFFFCFWVKQYFVLLKTGELLWLETDGSGPGNGNWNVKHGTAFNKFDYEGYSHPHRFTFSSDSSTCYLAFDTEEERNYWLEKLQDVSRS